MIYRFRIILDNDTDEDIFRDLEIRETDTLEDLHNIITQSFGFDGTEMASFYISNDTWDQGEEISLFDLSEDASARLMNETSLDSVVHEVQTKLIYVYDFLSLWPPNTHTHTPGHPRAIHTHARAWTLPAGLQWLHPAHSRSIPLPTRTSHTPG